MDESQCLLVSLNTRPLAPPPSQLLEAALCLALQQEELDASPAVQKGGVLTPASAMGMSLVERLRAAGLTLRILEESECRPEAA